MSESARTITPYDGRKYQTAEEAARAFYDHLKALFEPGMPFGRGSDEWADGLKFDIETFLKNPEESTAHGYGVSSWWVAFEAGPDSWGVAASCQFSSLLERGHIDPPTMDNLWVECIDGPWGFCETYWGFDLIFVDDPKVAHGGQVEEEP